MAKFIFVTGGVVSGIGKGISAASVGRLLKDRGYSVFMQKFDPYLNLDPGTMSPYQHGEVFVTQDGAETDLDLGHYERFIDVELNRDSSITSGKIYNAVIQKERKGLYDGKTVQVIPHVTDEIIAKVDSVANSSQADIIITEIGGTVGDIESQPFIEAIRQIHSRQPEDVMFIHTVLVPVIPGTDELKTKPAQHSFKQLMSYGIKPDLFILRASEPITQEVKEKISLFCDLPVEAIIESRHVDLIYQVPLIFQEQNLDQYILRHFGLEAKEDTSDNWRKMCDEFQGADKRVKIALVGKYIELLDAYLSLIEATKDAGYNLGATIDFHYIDAEAVRPDTVEDLLSQVDGVIMPAGFGRRGMAGMLEATRYAREHKIPFLGVNLGLHIAVLEASRNKLGWEEADSTEFSPDTKYPVIKIMDNQYDPIQLGGTMCLGNMSIRLKEGSLAKEIYGQSEIQERHRHRYQVNNDYLENLAGVGLVLSGINQGTGTIEIMEDQDHPFFIAVQYHPEFRSRPNNPHPLFSGFIKASMNQ